MQYGIYLPNFGPYGDARVLSELAVTAENAGWDGFFLWDHIAGWKLPMVDDWVALSAVAVATQQIRIGTTVTPLPRRRPWKLARETVSLDRLSGGRLTLGVGTGGGGPEWEGLGEEGDPKKRGAMLDEALQVMDGLWSAAPFSFEGEHYHVRDACFLPAPLQHPRIPVWVGGFWPNKAPFHRAARWDGVFPLFQAESEDEELQQFGEVIDFVRQQRTTDNPFDIVAMGFSPLGKPEAAAEKVYKREALGATWWLEIIAPFRFGKGFEDEWPLEKMQARILQGPPRRD